ncbi:dCTP pyrophosphatase 1-like isoform X2 [Chenopodium quinoa]|uniref:dCTP pyrophosphatase 1-like isoform X2 n=1 Tax=Chenopodium quinoa TaxID=63459 RepID=UPI000B77D901|nr:dCTP pyrophosphatase 1-like isoform X2 [Chenopodium quinoa]
MLYEYMWLIVMPRHTITFEGFDEVKFQVGEVGELSEIFQWKGEVAKGLPNWEDSDKEHLGEELSDVLLYLIRLSDICGIDLADAALKKMVKNAVKYPVNGL